MKRVTIRILAGSFNYLPRELYIKYTVSPAPMVIAQGMPHRFHPERRFGSGFFAGTSNRGGTVRSRFHGHANGAACIPWSATAPKGLSDWASEPSFSGAVDMRVASNSGTMKTGIRQP